jgi:hypothetical protein
MTPQERQLVDELFDRLSKLENAPRDPDAEQLIGEGSKRAPHAVYALVQTALVQDEALKRADARIQELQAQLGDEQPPSQPQGGFLDSMREAVFGHQPGRGSVPTVRPQGSQPPQSPFAAAPGYQSQTGYAPQAPAPGYAPQSPYPAGAGFGSGGSFLGTAASAAAGVIGGSLLLDGIRSMFGHHSGFGGYDQTALGGFGTQASPWGDHSGGSASGSDLARDAGLSDIGQSTDAGHYPADDRAGLFDTTDDGSTPDGTDFGGDDGGGGTDYA